MASLHRLFPAILILVAFASAPARAQPSAQLPAPAPFTLDAVMAYPFPSELGAAARGSRIAWVLAEQGVRNVFVAEGPDFAPRQLTAYTEDDGQELTSVSLSPDGEHVVFVRGGDHGANWDAEVPVNPASLPIAPKTQLWSVPFGGGEPRLLADGGDEPAISPRGDRVAFLRGGQVSAVPIDGSQPAKVLVGIRGQSSSLAWSPDGSQLAFVSGRGDHALIGIYRDATTPIAWMAPSTNRDGSPRWSPDGASIVFIRRPGAGGAPSPLLEARHNPWAIWIADARSGKARELWRAPATLRGNMPGTHGGANLHWAAGDRIVFMTELDGWPHMYSVDAHGGTPILLTPGEYMVEHVQLSPDRRVLLCAANTGPAADDIDRRHILRVPVDRDGAEVLTPGRGIETAPVMTGDGHSIVFLSATTRRPPVPAVMPAASGAGKDGHGMWRLLGDDRIPATFPAAAFVEPKQVTFRAPDGLVIHAQLFEPSGGPARKPAIVYVHGGPSRQMLLGWHYGSYYANAYAMNQHLASRGFVVLAVNFRRGIGYGQDFQRPARGGQQGASEYQDVKAAGEYLRGLAQVDPARIGIYGGSYGGYLTALALGRDSALFAAGVDVHGVHDFTAGEGRRFGTAGPPHALPPDRDKAIEMAWQSSPVAWVHTWTSPVLLIHGDDDRNVRVTETVDLVQRLRAAGVPFEEILIPDDTHHFMRHANQARVNAAIAEFFERKLGGGR
jgi:dipeptidyl aminopeptidase/acylaminoacyl peptidase